MKYMNLFLIIIFAISHKLNGSVTHIWPHSGTNDTIVNADIFGDNFNSGVSTLKLIRTGHPEINAFNVTVVNDNCLTCGFDLSGFNTGTYDLIINTDTLKMCFTLNERITEPYFFSRNLVNNCHEFAEKTAIGDGNNDGELEVYVGSIYGKIYQCKYNGSAWNSTIIGTIGVVVSDIKVGDGNNDGELEIYVSNMDSIYQYKLDGASWNRTAIGSFCRGIAVGDGNSDGIQEVYCVNDTAIYEYKFNGSFWENYYVGAGHCPMICISIGDGNNDGELEIYAGGGSYTQNGRLFQYKWIGNMWIRTLVNSYYQMGVANIVVCDGNRDGEFELYDSYYRYISQIKWDGSTWNPSLVWYHPWNIVYELCCGDGNNDGEIEIYASCDNDSIFQYKYNGTSWQRLDVGKANYRIAGLDVGDVDDNGSIEIYAASWDSMIYQFRTALSQNIVLSDTFHDFGNVAPGNYSYWQYLVIQNTGERQLTIDSVISTNNVYSIFPYHFFPDTILPNNLLPLQVEFQPFVEFFYPGTLKVYSDDVDDPLRLVYLEGLCDITPPDIESTTVVNDTAYSGPYQINVKITDNIFMDTSFLFYKRIEDQNWDSAELTLIGDDWFSGDIPQVSQNPDTVKYYILARDRGLNQSTDPDSAPSQYYSFVYSVLGVEEDITGNTKFSFSYTSPSEGKMIFRISLLHAGEVSLKIFDISGRNITDLLSGQSIAPGHYSIIYRPDNPGTYFYLLEAENFEDRGKFIVID